MKRPVFLTIWLVFMTLGAVGSLYNYTVNSQALLKAWGNLIPSWSVGVLALLSVAQLVGVILLWVWNKLGFYIAIATAIMAAAINGMLIGVAGLISTVLAMVGVLILYLAMKPVWKNFR